MHCRYFYYSAYFLIQKKSKPLDKTLINFIKKNENDKIQQLILVLNDNLKWLQEVVY